MDEDDCGVCYEPTNGQGHIVGELYVCSLCADLLWEGEDEGMPATGDSP